MSLIILAGLLIAVAAAEASQSDWTLTFEDNFDGDTLNSSRWNVANNMTHGPLELQLYVSEEVYLEEGDLILRTRRRRAHLNATYEYVVAFFCFCLLR